MKIASAILSRIQRPSIPTSDDSDVVAKRKRIQIEVERGRMTNLLTVYQLRKSFKSFVAVQDLTFGVLTGECFGFLGINGAGKVCI